MKNKGFFLGLLGVTLALGLLFTACPTEDDGGGNPFEGKWSGTAIFGGESAAATVTAGGDTWTFAVPSIGMNESGTYTYSGNSATLIQSGTSFGTAAVSGSTLTVVITSGDYAGGTGTFTK
jgi:hypothetical protein